jgi:uncharacterized repeat protein (TIGR04138 family)
MVDQPPKTIQDLVRQLEQYPEDALQFVREGLGFTAERLHGPETEMHRKLHDYLTAQGLDWSDLLEAHQAGALPPELVKVIDELGGVQKLNRHVSGRELCWGLRDYAIQRWGLLARMVLESWHVRSTIDFGRIVFGFIAFEMMRKQPHDSVEDFKEVYSFEEAFEEPYPIGANNGDAEDDDEVGCSD